MKGTELRFYLSAHVKFAFIEPCFSQKNKTKVLFAGVFFFLRCLEIIFCDFGGAEPERSAELLQG